MDTIGKTPRRRTILAAAAGFLGAAATKANAAPVTDIPIVDAHIHLFDGTRPQGATYMGSRAYAAQSKVFIPSDYRPLAIPAGIVGAVVVESSGWIEDNLWYLMMAEQDPLIVGVVGRIDTARPDFAELITRFAKNPLYRGIRHSRYYREENGQIVFNPGTVEGMRLLADLGLVLDTANPSLPLMRANLKLADAIPELKIVLDHLPAFDPTSDQRATYLGLIKELASRPNIVVKLTEVYHPSPDGRVARELGPIHEELDYLFNAFGEDRVMFGTDYPNSYGVATIPESIEVMRKFYATKSRQAAEKYFWKNSALIYRWRPRTAEQPRI